MKFYYIPKLDCYNLDVGQSIITMYLQNFSFYKIIDYFESLQPFEAIPINGRKPQAFKDGTRLILVETPSILYATTNCFCYPFRETDIDKNILFRHGLTDYYMTIKEVNK